MRNLFACAVCYRALIDHMQPCPIIGDPFQHRRFIRRAAGPFCRQVCRRLNNPVVVHPPCVFVLAFRAADVFVRARAGKPHIPIGVRHAVQMPLAEAKHRLDISRRVESVGVRLEWIAPGQRCKRHDIALDHGVNRALLWRLQAHYATSIFAQARPEKFRSSHLWASPVQ